MRNKLFNLCSIFRVSYLNLKICFQPGPARLEQPSLTSIRQSPRSHSKSIKGCGPRQIPSKATFPDKFHQRPQSQTKSTKGRSPRQNPPKAAVPDKIHQRLRSQTKSIKGCGTRQNSFETPLSPWSQGGFVPTTAGMGSIPQDWQVADL